MFDIWGFLLQTLTVSGVAVLLLIIKALFKDKLPPKWHFSVWSVLGIMILFPAGIINRYALFNWQTLIDFFKILIKDYSSTQVVLPFPVIFGLPDTFKEWIFLIYAIGVAVSLLVYLISYIRLRMALRKGNTPQEDAVTFIKDIAERHNIKLCKIVEMPGLPSAFVCGVIRPVLVVPENTPDEKVILHELFHLKNRDTFWNIVICILRCLHWCNPLIGYCANLAINDMESRCDQYVLEQLEGEERRTYGVILLSMSNERFAKTPGSTCINNGGKNIRKRIEAIARFKKYPVGMSLVSVCAIIALVVSLVIGTKAMSVPELGRTDIMSLAKAKSAYCSTYAGAFDTYAKAVIKESRCYRIICAPENEQAELIETNEPLWDCGLSGTPDTSKNYRIYNIESPEENVYEGLLVIQLCNVPEGFDYVENQFYLAYQKIRVFKSQNRWLVTPVSEFRYTSTNDDYIGYGCNELPGKTYTDTVDDYKVDITFQTVYAVNNKLEIDNDEFFSMLGNSYHFNSTPILDAEFYEAYDSNEATLTHLGTQEERDKVTTIGISSVPVYAGQEMPGKLTPAIGNQNSSSSSSDGTGYSTMTTEPGWGPSKHFYGVGGGGTFSELLNITNPAYFVADLYINNELYSRLELHLQKEEQK